jgi:uncharacterized delta-60 repeat protein
MKNNFLSQLSVLAVMSASTSPLVAAPGSLDTSFNNTGVVIKDFLASDSLCSVAILPDGKIVAAGTTDVSGHDDILVVRYLPNGTLDPSFSTDGSEITNLTATSNETATAMAIQPDGKIVVVGYTDATSGTSLNMFAVRFNANGGLDSSFGFSGKYTINPTPSADDRATGVKILPDGKIIIGGSARTNSSTAFALARLTASGVLDSTFSGDGYQEVAAGYSECQAMAVQPDGKIILVGESKSVGTEDFVVARCNSDGTLDNTFSADGVVKTNIIGKDAAYATTLQADGKIVVVGHANQGTDSVAVRYLTDGTLDTSFSSDGIYQESFGSLSSFSAVVLEADGKIILGGASGPLAGRNSTIVRLTTSGVLDETFDGDGYVINDLKPASGDFIFGMAFQPDGKLVAAGRAGNSTGDIALSRYNFFQKTDALVGTSVSTLVGNNIYDQNGSGQAIALSLKPNGKKKRGYLQFQNDGHEADSFAIKGTKGNPFFSVKYLSGGQNVTAAVTAGTFKTRSVASGASASLKVEITARNKSKGKKRGLLVVATSQVDMNSVDAVRINAKSK